MVCVAPILRAYASRSSGAPMTMTSPAPDSRAIAAMDCPTGPAPSTTTESSSRMSARSSRVQRRHQPAAAADERLRRQTFGQPDHLHARLHPDLLGPAAERPVVGAVGDAVDLARGAARGLLGDEALVAGAAGLVDVEERDEVAFAEGATLHVDDRPAHRLDAADRDMPRHERVGHAAEPPVLQVHVGAAHLAVDRAQQRGAWLEGGRGQLDDLDRCMRLTRSPPRESCEACQEAEGGGLQLESLRRAAPTRRAASRATSASP